MSIQAVSWALDQDLPARPKLVLISIANHANHTDGYCWLKAETIAAEAACTPRSVYRFVGALIRNGYLKKSPKKGDDGKQRANDYWMLFNRDDAAWDWGAGLGDDRDTDDAPEADPEVAQEVEVEAASSVVEAQDVVLPQDTESHGKKPEPADFTVTRQAENIPAVSCGPYDSRVLRKNIAEPSKTNPENVGLKSSRPRRYQPPPPAPPQPMGATTLEGTGNFIFVFIGTPAYEAWKKVKEAETGRSWHQQTVKDGRWGWHFPTLFPPQEKPPPGGSPLMTADDAEQFSKTG